MLADSVAGVDDRFVRGSGGDGGRAGFGVTENDGVHVGFEGAHRVGQRLAFGDRGVFHVVDLDD